MGTPVFAVFAGCLGAVDELLVAQRRLQRLENVHEFRLLKRPATSRGARMRRDLVLLADLLLSAGGVAKHSRIRRVTVR